MDQVDRTNDGPLAALRVLDLSNILPGPMVGMILGDYGADVIKVERPGGGDSERAGATGPDQEPPARFAMLNRNKRSVALDLKSERGTEAFLRLADTADVVLEGFRPGVVDRLGVGYDDVSARNPKIVYCSLSGYGQHGPYSAWPGHDINYLATAGVGHYMTTPVGADGEPGSLPWFPLADIAGGTYPAIMGILMALHARDRTGVGDYVDASMHDGATFLLTTRLHAMLTTVGDPDPNSLSVTGALPGYAIYTCLDGATIALGCLESVFWANLAAALNDDGWELPPSQPSGYDDDARAARRTIATAMASRPRDVWVKRLARRNVPASPVHTMADIQTDAHARARSLMPNVRLGDGLDHHVGHPVQLRQASASIRSRAPWLGEHTEQTLREAGLTDTEIEELTAERRS